MKAHFATSWRAALLLAALVLLVWGWLDFKTVRRASLREFDASAVGHLETEMWRGYYDRKRVAVFQQLALLLRQQYHMTWTRSWMTAYHAARAAFVFKQGNARSDYEKALPALVAYYSAIYAQSDQPFDVERVARLELEWWIIHRQRDRHPPGDLEKALAELQSAIFNLPAERFAEHARLRAAAMLIRDHKAEQGIVIETDWQHIDRLLVDSWTSLWKEVKGREEG